MALFLHVVKRRRHKRPHAHKAYGVPFGHPRQYFPQLAGPWLRRVETEKHNKQLVASLLVGVTDLIREITLPSQKIRLLHRSHSLVVIDGTVPKERPGTLEKRFHPRRRVCQDTIAVVFVDKFSQDSLLECPSPGKRAAKRWISPTRLLAGRVSEISRRV